MEQASKLGEQAEEVARLEGTLASALADRDALRDTVQNHTHTCTKRTQTHTHTYQRTPNTRTHTQTHTHTHTKTHTRAHAHTLVFVKHKRLRGSRAPWLPRSPTAMSCATR